jgi:hypothetical protein
MSEAEGFLARWGRRKREAKAAEPETPTQASTPESAPEPQQEVRRSPGGETAAGRSPSPTVPEFDVASLPPIESITAASDIRAFLTSGVPAELTRAALRRAWSADPAIRDFIGIAENQWDFTAPNEIHGFGPLGDGEEIRRLVASVFGDDRKEPDIDVPEHSVQSASADDTGTKLLRPTEGNRTQAAATSNDEGGKEVARCSESVAAMQNTEMPADDLEPAPRRGHGSALPQ